MAIYVVVSIAWYTMKLWYTTKLNHTMRMF